MHALAVQAHALEGLMLMTVFSAHVALLHWQPMPHQHIIDFLGKSL